MNPLALVAAIATALAVFLAFCALTAVTVFGLPGSSGEAGAFAPGVNIGLSAAQTDQARRALTVADEEHAGPLAVDAEVVAALGESNFAPIPNGQGSGYCGVFQASPANVACDDTEGQARSFLRGGRGFQAGGAILLAKQHPDWTPGHIAFMVEGDLSNFSSEAQAAEFYDVKQPQARTIIAAWRAGAPAGRISAGMTPKQIIDTIALPIANRDGVRVTPESVDAANAVHGPTKGGSRSDHEGPPDVAWAADLSNGYTTPQEDQLAADLAQRFGIPWHGAGLVSATHDGFRFQLIYRINTPQAGDHYTHVHFGVRRG